MPSRGRWRLAGLARPEMWSGALGDEDKLLAMGESEGSRRPLGDKVGYVQAGQHGIQVKGRDMKWREAVLNWGTNGSEPRDW